MSARLVFAGSPDFAVPALEVLADSGHELVAVLSQPDRPAGRGRKLLPCAVAARARELGLNLQQPVSLREPAALDILRSTRPDLIVVVAYGLLLPEAVLELPARGCVNVHASLLPRWRGASPVQAAIRAGDRQSGVCLMQMDSGLDTGPVLATAATDIGAGESAGSLHQRLAALGARLLESHLESILAGEIVAVPQPESGVTYAPRIKKRDGVIDWRMSAREISNQILAYNPWPVAETKADGARLRIFLAEKAEGAQTGADAGTIISAGSHGIDVAAGDGCIVRLKVVQAAGRARVDAAAYARGHELPEQLG